MSLSVWLLLFAADTMFAYWLLRRGGAEWMEGWKALFFVDWLHAAFWNAAQIKLYFLCLWIVHALWFALGLFMPEARALP